MVEVLLIKEGITSIIIRIESDIQNRFLVKLLLEKIIPITKYIKTNSNETIKGFDASYDSGISIQLMINATEIASDITM